MMSDRIIAYHFTGDKLRDGSPIPAVDHWLDFTGEVKMCCSGLHASRQPFDALQYAPGPMLHMVECEQIVAEDNEKLVCRRRRILQSGDATDLLRYFARMQALSIIHLWEPSDVIIDYLMTGDESLRLAAWAAAWTAAGAAWAAAGAAVAAARAAGAAARAARDAAGAAAREEFNRLVTQEFFDDR